MSEQSSEKTTPEYKTERLSGFGVEVLTDLLHLHEDRLPRTVIDECAQRGEPMVDALAALVDDRTYWDDDCSSGEWWALYHAVMILGLIPGERAGEALVAFMRRMDAADDDNLQEWLDGCWPALFANKPVSTVAALRALAQDRKIQWYMRLQALDTVVASAEREGGAAFDEALDWAATVAADETESWDLRLMSATTLLAFAPARHRSLLETLARRQSRREAAFTAKDIAEAYAGKGNPPDWRERGDPWAFYLAERIAERQQHWSELEADREKEDAQSAVPTFTREAPKVGRNDPCPCGSGKKYKKCCLAAEPDQA